MSKGGLSPYIELLTKDLNLLVREDPVCGVKRRRRYIFSDPFFTFYYQFIFDQRPQLELGRVDTVYDDIEKKLNGHVGRVFEEVVRQAFINRNGTDLNDIGLNFERIGKWWNRQGDEVDLVAEGENEILVGEIKWTNSPEGLDTVRNLLEKIPKIEHKKGRPVRPVFVCKSGLDENAEALAEEHHAIILDLQGIGDMLKV